MCLYPTLIKNRKYIPNKKNGGIVPPVFDERVLFVPIGCGKCMECMKQRARNWKVRLMEEIRTRTDNIIFVTLSFSDEQLVKLENEIPLNGYNRDNAVAKLAVKRFLGRWRKEYKHSIKHWLVTELGQINTERIHIHGLLWLPETIDIKNIERKWEYGNVWIGEYVNEKTINYIVKYLHKSDTIHKYYTPIILTSPGIGREYMNRTDKQANRYRDVETNEMYKTRQGILMPLPTYYRNKLYQDEEKEKLWINLMNKEKRYVNGIEIDVSQSDEDYYKVLEEQRLINKRLGYGDNEKDWDKIQYEQNQRNLKKLQRINKIKGF